ncbi:MAG: hypothetical protein AB7N80_02360 [Bdellovibrionales bacterium]
MKHLSSMRLISIAFTALLSTYIWAEGEPAPSTTQKMRQDLNQTLDSLETRIGELEVKTKKLSGKTQKEWDSTLQDLKSSRDKLKKDLADETAETKIKAKEYWARVKAAVADLEKGVSAATEKLKGKNE